MQKDKILKTIQEEAIKFIKDEYYRLSEEQEEIRENNKNNKRNEIKKAKENFEKIELEKYRYAIDNKHINLKKIGENEFEVTILDTKGKEIFDELRRERNELNEYISDIKNNLIEVDMEDVNYDIDIGLWDNINNFQYMFEQVVDYGDIGNLDEIKQEYLEKVKCLTKDEVDEVKEVSMKLANLFINSIIVFKIDEYEKKVDLILENLDKCDDAIEDLEFEF